MSDLKQQREAFEDKIRGNNELIRKYEGDDMLSILLGQCRQQNKIYQERLDNLIEQINAEQAAIIDSIINE